MKPKSLIWDIEMGEKPIVVYDACVLYPAPLRDLLMWLAVKGLLAARWSEKIQSEWIENLLRNRPDLSRERLQRTCVEMNRAIPDAIVVCNEITDQNFVLPDEDDRHVVETAIAAEAKIILTSNVKDFPPDQLPSGIISVSPDPFLCELYRIYPVEVLGTMREHRQMLRNPSKTVEEYLSTLEKNGLKMFVESVRIKADEL
ncbi:MAG: PIN domain-containing protein [Gemmataceae bacterium]